jgi:predicted RNase H-like HicB family nuclease
LSEGLVNTPFFIRCYDVSRRDKMRKILHVKITRGDNFYVAECMDLPVCTQGKTLDEVTENLKEAIGLHLEGEDLAELGIHPHYSILVHIELEPAHG